MTNKINWKMDELYNGCILASIAHAIMVAHYPLIANHHSWDGVNYNIQNDMGMLGTVTFARDMCVAGFRDDKSERAYPENLKNALQYFPNASQDVIEIAKTKTLQYLLIYDEGGEIVPSITTAFWGNKDELLTADSFVDFLENGGELLSRQAMNIADAIDEWEDDYDMNDEQVALLKLVYTRKIAAGDDEIIITKEEAAMIGESITEEGRAECITSFKEMNIVIEI